MTLAKIDPVADLGDILLRVEKPARYVGGEYGAVVKSEATFTAAIAFPDLYEIGMSNQAVRIIYNGLNAVERVRCERVFAPAPDFEAELASKSMPLYTLESGIPVRDVDLIGFSLGYELGATGVLSILRSSGIPLRNADRAGQGPIVFMGGPAASNPAPYSLFVDAIWIGEAEAGFFDLVSGLRDLKENGAGREDLMARIREEPAVWMEGKKAKRAVFSGFSGSDAPPAVLPVPSMRVVQDHGYVEIMRGCPNGCRFCHAGLWYRPMRQKTVERVKKEVSDFVGRGGYREVTLASLSSGDYIGISRLVGELNDEFRDRMISFQLPSLKVSSFSLPLLESLSETRKSGLTFAVETPYDAWQLSINKEVCRANVIAILKEAKRRGWKLAKFYFMIGLPLPNDGSVSEEGLIVDFLRGILSETGMQLNVNVGTFVPKPHTPYQWARQLSEEESREKLAFIRSALRGTPCKISTHDPFVSMLEGVLSRGDEAVSELVLQAFERGCRLDAWDDFIRKEEWQAVLSGDGSGAVLRALGGRQVDSNLPWDSVDGGFGKGFLKRELTRSQQSELTPSCSEDCASPCGVCSSSSGIVKNTENDAAPIDPVILRPLQPSSSPRTGSTRRMLFEFSKSGPAAFIPHLGLIEVFSRAFVRSGLPVKYTEGFNPLPRMDFASPLSIGIFAKAEIATVDMMEPLTEQEFITRLNSSLPKGFSVGSAYGFTIPEGVKKVSSPSILWGFEYEGASETIRVRSSEDKAFRESLKAQGKGIVGLVRERLLSIRSEEIGPETYFDSYAAIYGGYTDC